MQKGLVTIFGGSGFVGKYTIRALIKDGWRVRVPMRRPHTGQDLRVIGNVGDIQLMQANIRYPDSVKRAVEGSDAVINLVGILFETGKQSFDSVHVDGTHAICEAVKDADITQYIQLSAIGADAESESDYARTKGEAEAIVKSLVSSADILRPSIIFGPEDDFFNRFAAMSTLSPALPLVGGGHTKFQPVYVGNVAEAIAKCLGQGTAADVYELGGPHILSFKELLAYIGEVTGRKRFLAPIPWTLAKIIGFGGEISGKLPFIDPVLTRDQVRNLKQDNIVGANVKTFSDLGIELETIQSIVPTYMTKFRKHGQFNEEL